MQRTWKHFELVYSDATKCSLEPLALSRAHTKILILALDDDESIVSSLMDPGDDKYETWSAAISSWVQAVAILRKTLGDDDPLPGMPGYTEMLERDAEEMQAHLDEFTDALVDAYGSGVLTNYLHMLRAGHFKQVRAHRHDGF